MSLFTITQYNIIHMSSGTQHLLQDLSGIFHYPLVTLGESDVSLVSLLKFASILCLVFVAERLLRRVLIQRFLRRTHLQPSMQYGISKIGGYLFIAVGFYIALKFVGIDLSSLAFVAGAIGVGLGFGLQNVLSNFISGVIILAERPIAIGDRVEQGRGRPGDEDQLTQHHHRHQ
jgi:small-conductance mechanosensitive channel